MGKSPAGVQVPERLTAHHQNEGDASANTNITPRETNETELTKPSQYPLAFFILQL
ncbi:MAG: hypothetical protein KME16_26765 [Scytolyngbya sp. HA4215-MV1]|nr:hypothetical protein [Scytolyngbya sp. HA4215-MV1]